MKRCFKCERTLPLSEFYRHPKMGDGHLGKCKRCTRIDVRANRKAKHDYYVEYDRMRDQTPERIAALKMSANKDPLKVWARRQTHVALKRGWLSRQPCDVCGAPNADAHHTDYRRPLEVRWLCRQHHMETHHPLGDVA